VLEYYQNARLDESPDRQRGNPATTGSGLRHVAVKARPAGGAEGEENIPAMYARFVPKDSPSQPQVYLCALELGEAHLFGRASQDVQEELAAGGKTYRAALRFKRNYKPYTIKLKDVRKEDYLGTDTPRDYSSFIILNDPSRSIVDQEQHIWMNNPLRYAGETFYQSSYHQLADGREFTTLAVVTNTGWMIPYVACMIVVVGMLAHFLGSLRRFVSRRLTEEERRHATAAPERLERGWWGIAGLGRRDLVTVGAVAAAFVVVLAMALTKRVAPNGLNLDAFGELPIMYEGRIKPIDTLARNKLRIVSDKETFYSQPPGEGGGRTRRLPAIKWLLDVITRSDEADHHPVFRIENLDVQEALGLLPRPRFRYALDEFHDRVEHFDQLAREAAALEAEDPAKLTHFQRKLLETHQRLRAYVQLRSAFQPIPFPPLPSRAEAERDPAAAEERLRKIAELALVTPRFNQELMRTHPPRSVPVGDDDATWLPYAVAANEAYLATNIHRQPAHENVLAWAAMLAAYDNQDAAKFNKAVADYRARLTNGDRLGINLDKISFEAFVNRFQPFNLAMILYLAAFVINALAWLGWYGRFRRAALTLIILTFALHTFALFARIYISGRPPVTNLYSSAVFIGWGGVLLCILLELVYGLSIGNAIAAAGGFATLVIAHGLAADGDTFTVLQAVLDTQFWLATHVVCVTLGYATTFVAGTLGVGYILGSVFTPKITKDVGRQLCRMIYGIVCFSLFFSFFGTVLGGLWADDSWGRFWGWDPKENGALIIVLWNALILHARWGGMVAERGLAVLAVLGNVTTVWSWFGVNELGVGLHSYGFTEGTLPRLALFVLCQLIIAAIGCLPLRMWWSRT
jgi:ABC-type transport system involved in cytochrome c biogenesis permease subunit